MSKINNEIWVMSPDNTNVVKATHALSNRRGKNLKLVTSIIQYGNKDRFTTINVHQKYNVPNRGRDKGLIARNVQSINVKNKKTTVIDTDVEEDCCENDNYKDNHNKKNELALRLKELEY
ncbi:hypothetical protein RhiirA4_477048 [Rhizophagus irregularis]|uniref:Uncharacterized protein n=1 Tax=Rhizophagus irregularis TaxID=588596 RepID=A0A2I1HCL9_9GLOM|nr:hypothetical protein RhiirA4_477048 [Rhizophagus irregularis]